MAALDRACVLGCLCVCAVWARVWMLPWLPNRTAVLPANTQRVRYQVALALRAVT